MKTTNKNIIRKKRRNKLINDRNKLHKELWNRPLSF